VAATDRRRDVFCVMLLAVVPTVLLLDVLLAGANFFDRDLLVYHLPMKQVIRQLLLSGEFPFWNPYYSAGQPLAANPVYELFYPPQLLILAGSYLFGFALHIVFHIYAALIGMFVLLRQARLERPAAVFGALSFGFGGFLLGAVPVLPTFFIWSVAPWVAWGAIRFLQQPTARRFGLAALLAGMQALIGEPMALAQVWLLMLAGAVFAGERKPNWRAGGQILAVGAAAVLIAAVQLAPAFDHLGDSVRSRGIAFDVVKDYALPPVRPVEMAVPHAFGLPNPFAAAFWGRHLFDRQSPYLRSLYAGIFVVIFALAGFIMRLPGARTTAALAVLSYVLAIGDRTPVLRVLYWTGIARGFRYPEKFAALGIVALIVFASWSCSRFLAGDRRAWRATLVAAGIVLACSAAPLVWTLTPDYAASFMRLFRVSPDRGELPFVARSAWLGGFVLTAAAVVLVAAARRGIGRILLLLFGMILAVDLLRFGNQVLVRLPREFFDPPAITEDLVGNRREFALFHRGEWLPDDVNRRRFMAGSVNWTRRNGMPPFTSALWGFRSVLELDFDETALLPTHDMLDAMMALGNSGFDRWADPFATISNVRYVLDYRSFEQDRLESGGNAFRSKPVRATRLIEQPRYFFATSMHRVNTGAQALAFFRTTPQPYGVALVPFAPASIEPGSILRLAESACSVDLDVESSGRAFLVATVTRHKYWRATIDGIPARLVPVNIAYQGLYVPPGVHRIEMRYRNPVVIWSGVLSIAAAGIAGGLMMIAPARRPSSGPL
jgi:hypothetical protein